MNKKYIINFSGGEDFIAMLFKLIEIEMFDISKYEIYNDFYEWLKELGCVEVYRRVHKWCA